MHYLFNIAYAACAEHVWQFMQKAVYSIQDSTATFASVTELLSFMKRFKK